MMERFPLVKMLSKFAKRHTDLEKRVARLETLEFTSFHTGGWVEIATLTKADSTSGIFTFNNIPQVFLHLAMIFSCRCYDGISYDSMLMRFNNDSGTNYWYHHENVVSNPAPPPSCSTSCTTGYPAAVAFMSCGWIPAPDWLQSEFFDDLFNAEHLWIPDYRNQYKHKSIVWDNGLVAGEAEELWTNGRIIRQNGVGYWLNNNAITRIDVYLSTNFFEKNSKISLYGIGGTFQEYP